MVDIGIDFKDPAYDPNTTIIPRDHLSVRDIPNIKKYTNIGFEVCAIPWNAIGYLPIFLLFDAELCRHPPLIRTKPDILSVTHDGALHPWLAL